MTIENIEAKIKEAAAERAKISAELDSLRRAAAEAEEKANRAAEDGDVDLYTKNKAEYEKLSTAAFVKSRQLEKLEKPFTDEEILAAWKDYAAKYNKDIDKKLKEYAAARKALAKQYFEICDNQGEMLKKRKALSLISQISVDSFAAVSMIPLLEMPFNKTPVQIETEKLLLMAPDLYAFYGSGDLRQDMVDHYHMIVVSRADRF